MRRLLPLHSMNFIRTFSIRSLDNKPHCREIIKRFCIRFLDFISSCGSLTSVDLGSHERECYAPGFVQFFCLRLFFREYDINRLHNEGEQQQLRNNDNGNDSERTHCADPSSPSYYLSRKLDVINLELGHKIPTTYTPRYACLADNACDDTDASDRIIPTPTTYYYRYMQPG